MVETGILRPSERVELINGEIVVMTPIGPRHGAVVDRTTRAFIKLADDKAIVRTQGTIVLDRFVAPEPDIVLLRPRTDDYVTKNPGVGDILLIIEVAESSLEYDTTAKLGLYAILGIPEYWVADLQNRDPCSHRQERQRAADRLQVDGVRYLCQIALNDNKWAREEELHLGGLAKQLAIQD